MKSFVIKTKIKLLISIIIGIGATIFSFRISYNFLFPNYYIPDYKPEAEVLYFILTLIAYVSIIVFLIFWIKIKSRLIYLMLCVPIICIASGVLKEEYDYYIINKEYLFMYNEYLEYKKIIEGVPELNEYGIDLYKYIPFSHNNLLAKLDEEIKFNLTDNLPILDGATALYPIYAAYAQAVYPEGDYAYWDSIVLCSRTERAYENLLNSVVDIIFCLEPSDLHLQQLNDKKLDLKLIPIGKEAFVFFVNKENPIDNLTIENIHDIYSGKITNWETLNGINRDILVYQRPKNSGSQTILEKIMGNASIVEPRMEYTEIGMGDIIYSVANYRNFPDAIGYSFLHYSTEMVKSNQIKLLAIDNIFPSKKTTQDGSYPFSEKFYAIYIDSTNKNQNIELFIDWVLSKQGQELIEKTGYIPMESVYNASTL